VSRWNDQGMTGKGAAKRLRALKRAEAEERSTRTLPARRAAFRRSLSLPELREYRTDQHMTYANCRTPGTCDYRQDHVWFGATFVIA
jgi:hypothetical protein